MQSFPELTGLEFSEVPFRFDSAIVLGTVNRITRKASFSVSPKHKVCQRGCPTAGAHVHAAQGPAASSALRPVYEDARLVTEPESSTGTVSAAGYSLQPFRSHTLISCILHQALLPPGGHTNPFPLVRSSRAHARACDHTCVLPVRCVRVDPCSCACLRCDSHAAVRGRGRGAAAAHGRLLPGLQAPATGACTGGAHKAR